MSTDYIFLIIYILGKFWFLIIRLVSSLSGHLLDPIYHIYHIRFLSYRQTFVMCFDVKYRGLIRLINESSCTKRFITYILKNVLPHAISIYLLESNYIIIFPSYVDEVLRLSRNGLMNLTLLFSTTRRMHIKWAKISCWHI